MDSAVGGGLAPLVKILFGAMAMVRSLRACLEGKGERLCPFGRLSDLLRRHWSQGNAMRYACFCLFLAMLLCKCVPS
jgi:hypothetical protein